MSKIICVGLNKTGTTTLKDCLVYLGFTHYKFNRQLLMDFRHRNDFSRIFEVADKYDSFSDWPWCLIYKQLDERYPGSKFILTVRKDPQVWLRSLKRHSLHTKPLKNCSKLAYGYHYPNWHEQEHLETYEKHTREVIDYFKDRPRDFIVLSWEDGDGWRKLCDFLGKAAPNIPLPYRNRAKPLKINLTTVINFMLGKIAFLDRFGY